MPSIAEKKRKDLPGQLRLRGRNFPRPPRPRLGRRAWRVCWSRRPEEPAIVAADSRSRARARLWVHLLDLGYQPGFPEITARRAPEHDAWAAGDESGACLSPVLVPK